MAETISSMQSQHGTKDIAAKVAGGPTASRAYTGVEAMNDLLQGKKGTYSQVATMKSLIPFNNLIGIDQFNKGVASDILQESKRMNYYND